MGWFDAWLKSPVGCHELDALKTTPADSVVAGWPQTDLIIASGLELLCGRATLPGGNALSRLPAFCYNRAQSGMTPDGALWERPGERIDELAV